MAYRRFIIICLVLSLCTSLSLSADEFLSIDCGSSLPYKDGNGITWVGDDKYVLSGESRSVKPENSTSYRVADTLRVFTTQNKNCYHIDSVKQGRVLVRAGFNYGNYDGKNSPPTFALHFDGNEWVDVDTSDYYFHEVTYVMKRDTISICLTRTEPDQFPFITFLQIRSLEMSMYSNAANIYPLFLWKRVAFGTNTIPPLINAMEVFRIGDSPLTDGTNKRDVQGLASLQERFEVLRGWSGDPCLPAPHTWDWIKCNDNPIPRVTALSLGRYGLSGLLPDFSSLDALQTIYLHNNSLRGPIPDFLGTFVNLKTLDLSNNHFSGALPDSLANNKKIKLKLAGNSLQLPPPATTAVQLPPPIKTGKVIFPRRLLFPLAPNPPFGGGSFNQMPRAAGRINSTKFPKILKFTLPPGAVATVLGTVYGICCCRRRRLACY